MHQMGVEGNTRKRVLCFTLRRSLNILILTSIIDFLLSANISFNIYRMPTMVNLMVKLNSCLALSALNVSVSYWKILPIERFYIALCFTLSDKEKWS